jgi:hypothetical protein|tara:strand:+ start:466 stop:726 length:261 start_codon:yes stop_codon:yes gene_type:complete
MFNKVKIIFYLLSFFTFIFLVLNFYFSDLNIKKTNKNRSISLNRLVSDIQKLPLLKNDTEDIIEYKDDIENYKKKKKKYKFWDLVK